MQHHRNASSAFGRALAAMIACVAALALAGPATAATDRFSSERGSDQATPELSPVGDRPADRAPASSTPTTGSGSPSSSDDSNTGLIVGLSLATVALLGSGTFVARRRRHVAPGH
jgi:hypothetical protein